LHNLAFFEFKTPIFLLNFSAKIFKNHNIGPRLGNFSPTYILGDCFHWPVYRKWPK
jgi:hypothetical protein